MFWGRFPLNKRHFGLENNDFCRYNGFLRRKYEVAKMYHFVRIKKITFAIIFGLLCFFAGGECGDVVAILMCDTHADNIEQPVAMDLKNMCEEVARIATYTKRDLKELIYTGDELFPEQVLDDVKGLAFHPDDIVIFYFSGHGYRTESKDGNPWPNMFFTMANQAVDYDLVCQILYSKNPRLLITIADCCNNYMDERGAPPVVKGKVYSKAETTHVKKNYQELFLNTEGLIMIRSSEVGEYSWCMNRGAIYTLALLDSIKLETLKQHGVSWDSLLERAASSVCRHQTPVVYRDKNSYSQSY
ncbi:MAG: hypothetical protein K940chlam7_02108 [Chlamydiae bacterium]|nr:hypothetical protein [Chlamydiota bacterium]